MKIKEPTSSQPIPKNGKCVFSGIRFSIYQWEQQLFDGSYSTFEKAKRRSSVSLLPIVDKSKIILTKQSQPGTKPFYSCVGGVVDDNERIEETAKRELLEETGMKSKKLKFWYSEQPTGVIEWSVYWFIAKHCSVVQPTTPDSGEKIEILKVNFEDFFEIVISNNFRDKELTLKLLQLKERNKLPKVKEMFFTG